MEIVLSFAHGMVPAGISAEVSESLSPAGIAEAALKHDIPLHGSL